MAKQSNKTKRFFKNFKKGFLSLYSGWRAAVMFVVTIFFTMLTLTLSVLLTGTNEIATYVFFAICVLLFAWTISYLVFHKARIRESIEDAANRHELTKNLLEMYGFDILVLELVTFVINIAYAFFLAVISITRRSIWYGSLAIFFILLMIIRLTLLVNQRMSAKKYSIVKLWTSYEAEEEADRASMRSKLQELKTYRICGWLILTLTLVLSISIMQRVVSGGSKNYSGLMIYFTAAYTFYKIIASTIRFVKNRKHKNHYVKCFQNINLIDAAVSLFSLQAALFMQFGGNVDYFVPNAVLGIAVCIFIVATGITMIIRGTLENNNLTKPKSPTNKPSTEADIK